MSGELVSLVQKTRRSLSRLAAECARQAADHTPVVEKGERQDALVQQQEALTLGKSGVLPEVWCEGRADEQREEGSALELREVGDCVTDPEKIDHCGHQIHSLYQRARSHSV